MKIGVKKLIRDEKGQVLIMALILLLISGLIAAPLLSYMNTGLLAGGVYERKADELYAADAGVEDAIWKVQHQVDELPYACGDLPWSYDYETSDVNDKHVQVYIDYLSEGTYRITSIAVTDDGGGTAAIVSGTKIEAYVTATYGDFSGLLDNVITSQHEIVEKSGVVVNPKEGEHGPYPNYPGSWPTPADLEGFYGENVTDATYYYGDTEIDLEGNSWPSGLGPLYIDGKLTIKNSDKNTPATLKLTGTLYITGDTLICYGTSQNRDMTLDLNGQTIFVESSTADALKIGDMCTIMGPGVIIAVGDIYFKPKAQAGGEENPIFILSVSGTTQVQPQGDFYGAIAGSVEVDLWPGTSLNYPEAGFGGYDLNFPGFTEDKPVHYSIASWEVGPPE